MTDDRFKRVLGDAQQTFLRNADRLATLFARRPAHKGREINGASILVWLAGVTHQAGNSTRAHAYAHGRDQSIRYNPRTVAHTSDDDLEDLILHELGHLFTSHFLGHMGHDADWQNIGFVVGYAPVGCTSNARRAAYRRQMVLYRMAAATGTPVPNFV